MARNTIWLTRQLLISILDLSKQTHKKINSGVFECTLSIHMDIAKMLLNVC